MLTRGQLGVFTLPTEIICLLRVSIRNTAMLTTLFATLSRPTPAISYLLLSKSSLMSASACTRKLLAAPSGFALATFSQSSGFAVAYYYYFKMNTTQARL